MTDKLILDFYLPVTFDGMQVGAFSHAGNYGYYSFYLKISESRMRVWQKLISDPDAGPRAQSPMAFGAIGLGLSFLLINTFITGSLQISKRGDDRYIHFADHPKTFVLSCLMMIAGAVWAFAIARKRYLMHDD